MRICFFSLNRLAFQGGAEKYIIEVGRALKEKGNEVFYLGDCRPLLALNVLAGFFLGTANFSETKTALLTLKKLPSFPSEARDSIISQKLKIGFLAPFSRTRKNIKEFLGSCDLILVKNEILDMLAFCLFGVFGQKPKTALLAFSAFFYPSKTRRGKLHNLIYTSSFYGSLARRYNFVVVSNKQDVSFVERQFKIKKEKIKYVPYGLDPKDFPLKLHKRSDNFFRILFVGRLEEQKGVDILAKIIKILSKEKFFSKLKFTIIGDGPWRSEIVSLTKNFSNVSWLGVLPREKVKEAYYTHELLIVPSRWETFSYVTLEAQFCGLPVVAFDIPGPQDIIENGRTGILVPIGNISLFEKAIIEYLRKNATIEARQYIRIRAYKEFSLDETAKKILNL